MSSDISEWEKDSLMQADRLLKIIIKDLHSANTTMFDELLNGMIDTKAQSNSSREHSSDIEAYKSIIKFCADRIFEIGKQRKTVKALNDIKSEFSSRNEYVKEYRDQRSKSHLSVGEHRFNSLANEPEPSFYQQSQEQLQEIEEVFSYYSAKRMLDKQRKLSGFANGIRKDLLDDRLKSVLERHQVDTVTEAVTIINGLKDTIKHAKERKAREEKRLENERKYRDHRVKNAIDQKLSSEMEEVSAFSLALYLNMLDANSDMRQHLEWRVNKYIETSRHYHIEDIFSYIIDQLVPTLKKKCFKTKDCVVYEEIKKPDDAVDDFYKEWKSQHKSIVNNNKDLFDRLAAKAQVEKLKDDIKNSTKLDL